MINFVLKYVNFIRLRPCIIHLYQTASNDIIFNKKKLVHEQFVFCVKFVFSGNLMAGFSDYIKKFLSSLYNEEVKI